MSASSRFIIIDSGSKETSEVHVIDLKGVRCGTSTVIRSA
jgi:protease II